MRKGYTPVEVTVNPEVTVNLYNLLTPTHSLPFRVTAAATHHGHGRAVRPLPTGPGRADAPLSCTGLSRTFRPDPLALTATQ